MPPARPLTPEEVAPLHARLRDWAVAGNHHLEKEWRFPDFAAALAFVNRCGAICEARNHHADFELAWGRVRAKIWSHDAGGLTERDFALAAELDRA